MKEPRAVYIEAYRRFHDGEVETWYVRYAVRTFRQRYLAAQFYAKDISRQEVVDWVNQQPHLKLVGEKKVSER